MERGALVHCTWRIKSRTLPIHSVPQRAHGTATTRRAQAPLSATMGNKHPRPLRPGETPPPDAVPGQGDGPAPAASSTPDDSKHGTPAEAGPAETAGAPAGAQKACLDDFELLKTVGKGSFGKVVQVRRAGRKPVGTPATQPTSCLHRCARRTTARSTP